MYATSEEAIDANHAITYGAAARELARHGMQIAPPSADDAHDTIRVWDGFCRDAAEQPAWETIPCTTKAVLEWLGY